MRQAITIALAAAMGISGVLTGVAPTQAAAMSVAPAAMERAADRASNVQNVDSLRWNRGHHWRGNRNWHRGQRWHSQRRYYRGRHYYHGRDYYRHRDNDAGAAVAAGILGLAAGAIVGGALSNRGGSSDRHAYCASKYRSYDPASGTYLGYDGYRHPCR